MQVGEILWIEDEERIRKSTIPLLQKQGLRVRDVSRGDIGLELLKQNAYSLVLLDLKLNGIDGIEILNKIRKFNRDIPVIILSAFTEDPEYREKLKALDFIDLIPKPIPMVTSRMFPEFIARIRMPSLDYMSQKFDPFIIRFDDYMNMSSEQVTKLQNRIQKENKIWIEQKLAEKKVKWMVVCNPERVIIKCSNRLDDYPTKEELQKMGQHFNRIPYVFFKTPKLEEIKWRQGLDETDYYPVIEFYLIRDKKSIKYSTDFDTGCEHTLFDAREMEKHNLINRFDHLDFPKRADHYDKEYHYCIKTVIIKIMDEEKREIAKDMNCFVVQNWRNSPFGDIKSSRIGIVGRDILQRFPVQILLDGKKKTTKIFFSD